MGEHVEQGKWRNYQRAYITPSFVLIVMMMMITGSYFFCLMKIYNNRLVVRDAVDAAAISAIAANGSIERVATDYYEEEVCDEFGDNCHYVNRQGSYRSYVYINVSKAQKTVEKYLKMNIDNNLGSNDYKILNLQVVPDYDEERYIEVSSDRPHTKSRPSNWWKWAFGDSDPTIGYDDSGDVRFPRWARLTVTAEVEIKVPLSKLFGDDGKMHFTWTSSVVKEMRDEP